MLILNPTQKMLDKWYRCNKHIANYLINSCGLEHIYQDKKLFYYFPKTQDLLGSLDKMPIYVKILALL